MIKNERGPVGERILYNTICYNCGFGCIVLDGTQWELKIYFSNGHKLVKIYGDNAYLYNFDRFQKLLGIELD